MYSDIYTRPVNAPNTPESLLQQIAQIQHMERGKPCVLRQGPQGPYYNHQTWENGKNVSRYVPQDQVPALQQAIAGYVPWGNLFKWRLQTVNIEFHSEVYLRPSYPSPSVETTVRNFENDHVNDFTTWASSVGKPLADQTEGQFTSTYWLLKSSCESAVAKAMRNALHPSLEKAIDDTKEQWDRGLHDIAVP